MATPFCSTTDNLAQQPICDERRSGIERRSGFDRRLLSPQAREALRCCQLAGAQFIGIQTGFGRIPDLCLFQAGRRTTTLSVPVTECTPLRIMERLSESRAVFMRESTDNFITGTALLPCD